MGRKHADDKLEYIGRVRDYDGYGYYDVGVRRYFNPGIILK